ncbi:hypothetical protein V6N11_002771 [Hibiscus sabdariffa]|uniref:Uncharacterized protein n=1 Tax=Hibiscus sabdariffa TaxID=183260 RepID=A0ABR2SBD2_9ROSI
MSPLSFQLNIKQSSEANKWQTFQHMETIIKFNSYWVWDDHTSLKVNGYKQAYGHKGNHPIYAPESSSNLNGSLQVLSIISSHANNEANTCQNRLGRQGNQLQGDFGMYQLVATC